MITAAGSSFMPHSGQRSGCSRTTAGCIGQVYAVAGAAVASSFMPQSGQRPGSSANTAGCIGHV